MRFRDGLTVRRIIQVLDAEQRLLRLFLQFLWTASGTGFACTALLRALGSSLASVLRVASNQGLDE